MCGPHFYSIKITEDLRRFAAQQELSDEQALQTGMEEKAREFSESGAEITRSLNERCRNIDL
jgi:phosphomethylpyrimidine synthase